MNIRKSSVVLCAAAFFAMSQLSSAQSAVISEQDYWSGIKTGYRATQSAFPRRETHVYESMAVGKVTYSRTEVSEYSSASSYRTIKTVVSSAVKSVSEAVQIGRVRYCRENSAEWKSYGCYHQPPAPLGDAYETTYSIEIKNDSKTYVRIAKSKHVEEGKPDAKHITEDRFVLNPDSSIRGRSIITTSGKTKQIVSKDIDKYEYQIVLKQIEAPIK